MSGGTSPLIAEALARHPQMCQMKFEDGPGRRLSPSFGVKLGSALIFLHQDREAACLMRPAVSGTIAQVPVQIDVSE